MAAILLKADTRRSLTLVALVFGGHFAAYAYITPYLLQHAELDFRATGWAQLGYGVAGIVGNFVASKGVDQRLRATLASCLILVLFSFVALDLGHRTAFVAICAVTLWGLGFGGIPLCLSTWMARISANAPEAASAPFISVIQIAIAVGTLTGGIGVDTMGIGTCAWIGATLVSCGLLVLLAVRTGPRFSLNLPAPRRGAVSE